MRDAHQPQLTFGSGFARMIGKIILIRVKTLRNTNLVATKHVKRKKGLTSGWRRELSPNPGLFFPWVRVPRAPSPSAREVSLLPCYFYPLLGRPLSGKRHAYRGKVRFNFSGKNNCLTWNFEQLCMVHRQELQTIEYLQKWENLSKNQGEIRTPTKRKKKWYKSTADNKDLNKYYTRDALLSILHPERWVTKRDAAQNF